MGRLGEAITPERGVVAGCACATSMVRLYCLTPIDRLIRTIPRPLGRTMVSLGVFIDDFQVEFNGPNQCLGALALVVKDLAEIAKEDLETEISVVKAQVVASSRSLGRDLLRLIPGLPGQIKDVRGEPGHGHQVWQSQGLRWRVQEGSPMEAPQAEDE